jgi:cytochrome c-type biogenesis protein CcmH/NrfF
LRAEILRRLQAGETPSAIEDDLVARFGPSMRTEPAFKGIGIVAWVAPLAFAGAGFALVVVVVRRAARRRRPLDADATAEPGNDPDLNDRVQDELDALD